MVGQRALEELVLEGRRKNRYAIIWICFRLVLLYFTGFNYSSIPPDEIFFPESRNPDHYYPLSASHTGYALNIYTVLGLRVLDWAAMTVN